MPREALRKNTSQHQPKNKFSKNDDKNIDEAMKQTKQYLEERFSSVYGGGGGLIISYREIITLR